MILDSPVTVDNFKLVDGSTDSEDLEKNYFWKCKKWCGKILVAYMEKVGDVKGLGK